MAKKKSRWQILLETLLHLVVGAGAAAGAAYLKVPGVDPITAAVVGSALSSLGSAFVKPPNTPKS